MLMGGGQHAPLVEAITPMLQGKKLDINSLLPLLPLLFTKKEQAPADPTPQTKGDKIIRVDDYRRL